MSVLYPFIGSISHILM